MSGNSVYICKMSQALKLRFQSPTLTGVDLKQVTKVL